MACFCVLYDYNYDQLDLSWNVMKESGFSFNSWMLLWQLPEIQSLADINNIKFYFIILNPFGY